MYAPNNFDWPHDNHQNLQKKHAPDINSYKWNR